MAVYDNLDMLECVCAGTEFKGMLVMVHGGVSDLD